MYAVPSMSGLMTSNTKEQRNNKTTKTTTTAASNQSIKPKNNNNNNNKNNRQKRTNKAKKNTTLNEDSRQGNHTRKKSFTSYKFALIQLLIPGPVRAAMPNDMETTTAGRPVDSKFEVTTESNDDDV